MMFVPRYMHTAQTGLPLREIKLIYCLAILHRRDGVFALDRTVLDSVHNIQTTQYQQVC
jgi:hypothetical protein